MSNLSNFPNGSRWVRADFHLHTKADNVGFYDGDDSWYYSKYIDALEQKGIKVGVITNHNKFDLEEFIALGKIADKKGIYFLPGVELSVDDGHNGIHTIIVFSSEWITEENNFIESFLCAAYGSKDRKGRCSLGLLDTLRMLEKYGKDFFVVFAHVEQSSGLWEELKGGRIEDLGRNDVFKKHVLAFQKVRTYDKREQIKAWFNGWYPAEVEGSDPKKLSEIGKGKPCWLKIGDFNFGAIQYALHDYENRVTSDEEKTRKKYSLIKSISFEGGILDGKTVALAPELNTLIGIRGSGKSAILETIRYVLDIPFGDKALDLDYKKGLVNYALSSGGKATLRAVDERGQEYEMRRINNEAPDIYVDGSHRPGISIRETILRKPMYFGQKDLSSTGVGFEKDLVEKLVGEKVSQIWRKIEFQKARVVELVTRLKKLADAHEKKKEYEAQKSDAEYRLVFYKKHGVEEKLQKQVGFDTDFSKCKSVIESADSYLEDLRSFIEQHEDDLKNQRVYTSGQNVEFFTSFFSCYDKLIASFERIKCELAAGNVVLEELKGKSDVFSKLVESLKEKFAEIERKLAEELKESGGRAIDLNEFRSHRRRFDEAVQMIKAIDKEELTRANLHNELMSELAALNDLWHEEFKAINTELEKVNENHSSLSIDVEYKGDSNAFVSFMKENFKGSKIRETTFQNLAGKFPDFVTMYKEPEVVRNELGSSEATFCQYFDGNLGALLTYQVPNKFTIKYRDKELKDHSLGQRASALILFVLGQRDNDVFIIDQPEDDLDNQTIYEDVIKLIRELKPNAQFIFATHNPNFPVLGDAEQIVACSCLEDKVQIQYGSIDAPDMQQKIIDIMEGGQEAFRLREGRYNIWKRQNYSK
jgi:predicted ATPase